MLISRLGVKAKSRIKPRRYRHTRSEKDKRDIKADAPWRIRLQYGCISSCGGGGAFYSICHLFSHVSSSSSFSHHSPSITSSLFLSAIKTCLFYRSCWLSAELLSCALGGLFRFLTLNAIILYLERTLWKIIDLYIHGGHLGFRKSHAGSERPPGLNFIEILRTIEKSKETILKRPNKVMYYHRVFFVFFRQFSVWFRTLH